MRNAYVVPGVVDEKVVQHLADVRLKTHGERTRIHLHRSSEPCDRTCYEWRGDK